MRSRSLQKVSIVYPDRRKLIHKQRHVHCLLQFANNKLGAHALDRGAAAVNQMLLIDATSMGSVTDTVALRWSALRQHQPVKCRKQSYVVADVQRQWDPDGGDASLVHLQAVDVPCGVAAGGVDVACKTRLVLWIADQENPLDGDLAGARELGQCIHGGGGALRVAFKDEALVGRGREGGLDVVDNLRAHRSIKQRVRLRKGHAHVRGRLRGVLVVAGGVDCVIL